MPSRRLPVSWDLEASIWPGATSQPGAGQLAEQPAKRLGSRPASLARPAGPAQPRQLAQSGRLARATKTARKKQGKFCDFFLLVRILANLSLHFFPPVFSWIFSRFSRIFFPDFFPGFFPGFFFPDFFPGFFPQICFPDISPDFLNYSRFFSALS